MDARTIRKALRKHVITSPIFRDVLASDQLPEGPSLQHGIYIVNTHPVDLPGEHWVSVEYTVNHVYYFDPYGLPPHPAILTGLRRSGALRSRTLQFGTTRLQGQRQTCGLYCIYHTLTRSSPNHTMDIFNTDLDFNDRLVYRLVCHSFDVGSL